MYGHKNKDSEYNNEVLKKTDIVEIAEKAVIEIFRKRAKESVNQNKVLLSNQAYSVALLLEKLNLCDALIFLSYCMEEAKSE